MGMVVGDARSLPVAAGSVQCVVTSPPYWGLRDYGTATWEGGDPDCDHRGKPMPTRAGFNERYFGRPSAEGNKQDELAEPMGQVCSKCGARRIDRQLGLESTPDAYVANMVAVFREVWRVLRDDGTLWLNLGDSYARQGGRVSDQPRHWDGREDSPGSMHGTRIASDFGSKPKDLVGIPWRVAFALQADGWYLRQDIIWAKPNPMPESVRDRCTKAHEYLFLLTKRQRYYYDAEAIAESAKWERWGDQTERKTHTGTAGHLGNKTRDELPIKDTKNKRSVWTLNTQPYPEAHFATFPEKLVEPCVLAGTSARGCCPLCRTPWVRVVESRRVMCHELPPEHPDYRPSRYTVKASGDDSYANGGAQAFRQSETIGWRPDCFCMNDPANDAESLDAVPCLVLDPFAGSGTVGVVCRKLARRFVGVELNPKYVDLARARMARVQPGLALEVA